MMCKLKGGVASEKKTGVSWGAVKQAIYSGVHLLRDFFNQGDPKLCANAAVGLNSSLQLQADIMRLCGEIRSHFE